MGNKKGFTLIEILVSMGIFVLLVAITIVAISPGRQFSQANNARRQNDVLAILNAVGQYSADHGGTYPPSITLTSTEISKTGIDLCSSIVPLYLTALPVDPGTNSGTTITVCSGSYRTNYQIMKDANNRIAVFAPGTELGITAISAYR